MYGLSFFLFISEFFVLRLCFMSAFMFLFYLDNIFLFYFWHYYINNVLNV